MESEFTPIKENIGYIRNELLPYPQARVMAVVKTRTTEEILCAIACGIDLLGENRVQELLSRYEALRGKAELHFIGTLQKNKVKYIIDKVDMIESVDSLDLAKEIERQAQKHCLQMPVLLEVNIGREENKSGVLPEELPALCGAVAELPHLLPMGLMTMAPICQSEEEAVRYFAAMRDLRDKVFCPMFPEAKTALLSMGMSESYRAALSCGADIVRIGKGIFGDRRAFPTN